jgi:3-dehydroquinate dehydratase-2
MSRHFLVLHGANLELLGRREPDLYGTVTLAEIRSEIERRAKARGDRVSWISSNHEGELLDALGRAVGEVDGILINPGGFTHTSVALRDALCAVGVPTIEVHLTNIHARERFRRRSFVSPVVSGVVCGLGAAGVVRAFESLMDLVEGNPFPPAARSEDR